MKLEIAVPTMIKPKLSDDAIAGACAGGTARLLSAPFDVLKIRFQLQGPGEAKYKGIFQSFSTVIKEEGILALWKGNLSATYLWVTYMAVQFTMYGVLKRIGEDIPNPFRKSLTTSIGVGSEQLSVGSAAQREARSDKAWKAFVLFLAGAGAGIASVTATYPFDIMRTQFALQGQEVVYKSMGSFISHTFKTKGVRGFYAGLSPAMVGITPQMGLNFALYESFKALASGVGSVDADGNAVAKQKDSFLKGTVLKGLCGGAAGGLSKLTVYPLDTVKKRLQAQVLRNTMSASVQTLHYNGFFHCFKTIYATEGITGFYRGIVATTAKSVVSTAITFAAYEAVKDLLAVTHTQGHDGAVKV